MMKGKVVRRFECCKYQVYCNGTLCFTWFRTSSRGKIFTSYSIPAITWRSVHRHKRKWARHIQALISGTHCAMVLLNATERPERPVVARQTLHWSTFIEAQC